MFRLQKLLPHHRTLRKLVDHAIAREEAAMRIAAVAHDRFRPLLEEAQRRQDAHEELCKTSAFPVIPTAGLDSVYEDVCAGRL
jgi:glutamate racemase